MNYYLLIIIYSLCFWSVNCKSLVLKLCNFFRVFPETWAIIIIWVLSLSIVSYESFIFNNYRRFNFFSRLWTVRICSANNASYFDIFYIYIYIYIYIYNSVECWYWTLFSSGIFERSVSIFSQFFQIYVLVCKFCKLGM